jgi:hypothetical protein
MPRPKVLLLERTEAARDAMGRLWKAKTAKRSRLDA